jgi:methylated-DNA-[protein]-cysteine S-methyltransferase
MNYYQSPIGLLEIKTNERALTGIRVVNDSDKNKETVLPTNEEQAILKKVRLQLDEYFSGKRKKFDLPLELHGTDFQQKVWKQLQQIPYGKTISYAQLAQAVGNPKAYRAAGSANGKNPVAIIIPCHRVIASDNSLGGYAYGLDAKKCLLKLETVVF